MAESIILDAGHGGWDNGASYQGRNEKDDNLAMTLAVGDILEGFGFQVFYTRTEDIYQRPFRKATIANEIGGDLFVSIHRNSSPVPNQYHGVETLVYSNQGLPKLVAENINRQLEAVGYANLGVEERPGLIVLNSTQMPAVLVEVGFINSDIDNTLFNQRFQETAMAIAEGIRESFRS
ncbi:MAG: N-acetylmuramoyl-L-alanine amidase [Lachnospiraceae bacterium]